MEFLATMTIARLTIRCLLPSTMMLEWALQHIEHLANNSGSCLEIELMGWDQRDPFDLGSQLEVIDLLSVLDLELGSLHDDVLLEWESELAGNFGRQSLEMSSYSEGLDHDQMIEVRECLVLETQGISWQEVRHVCCSLVVAWFGFLSGSGLLGGRLWSWLVAKDEWWLVLCFLLSKDQGF